MSTVIYTKIKELEIQDKEVYEFGNWLKNFNNDPEWVIDEETYNDDEEEIEKSIPQNKKGEEMEYPWNSFSYIVVPDTDQHNLEAENIAESLGSYERFDIEDSDRTFFVVK